jgi:hypothetical protein
VIFLEEQLKNGPLVAHFLMDRSVRSRCNSSALRIASEAVRRFGDDLQAGVAVVGYFHFETAGERGILEVF